MRKVQLALLLLVCCPLSVSAQQYNQQPVKVSDEKEEKGVRGFVLVSAIFRASGEITDITILNHPAPELTKEAVAAAKKIKFTPAEKDGKPVSVRMQMEFTIQLLQPAKIETRQALGYLFRLLSQENLDALVKALEKRTDTSTSPDNWAIACEKTGALGLSSEEQKEYQALQQAALRKLEAFLRKRAEDARNTPASNAEAPKEQVIFASLLFEGAQELSKEKRLRLAELHNKAMAFGLKQSAAP